MNPHEKVYRAFTERLAVHRFQRKMKTLWWERQREVTWNRIHVHKFRLSYHFRIHGALHVRPDEADAPWLNGPYSADGFYEERVLGVRKKFLEFSFQDREESISKCADSMSKFVELCILPWFERWDDKRALLEDSDSPLSVAQKEMLRTK
jgi:hypothetical protein